MEEINYLMPELHREKEAGKRHRKHRIREEHFWWHGFGVRLTFADSAADACDAVYAIRAAKSTDSARRGQRMTRGAVAAGTAACVGDFWTAPELDSLFPKRQQPIPGPELASFFLRAQPFRENLVLLLDEKQENGTEWWQEQFLEACFQDLNGLYLVGAQWAARQQDFFDWICAQSGLLVCVTDSVPVTDGRKTVVAELRQNRKPPVKELAEGSIYLDLTSDADKQRLLLAKRTDISYISARNYLDTAFKARYNAF